MTVKKIILNGQMYVVSEGSIIRVKGDLGNWIKIFSDDYEITATRISISNGMSTFHIDKIIYYDKDTEATEVISQEIEDTSAKDAYRQRLSKLRKADLIKEAKTVGVKVGLNMKKADIVDALVDAYNK